MVGHAGAIMPPGFRIRSVQCRLTNGASTMTDSPADNAAPAPRRFSPWALLLRESPYLLMLVLAVFGVAYTSFSGTPMTLYWIVLAPLIGIMCVVTRWRDAATREQRVRL